MRKILRFLLALVFVPFLAVNVLLCNAVQMLSLALRPFSLRAFQEVNRCCVVAFFGSVVLVLKHVLRVELRQTGDPVPPGENVFLVSNHQSMSDIPPLLLLAYHCGRIGDTKWFVKDQLKWVPGVGWGILFLDWLYVKRNWSADREKVMSTFARLRANRGPFWVISFVEGTRATPQKLERSREFCRKAKLPPLQYVMAPRTKGFEATLEGLGELTQAVYDVTLAYEGYPPGKAPGLRFLFFGPVERVHLHVRRFPLAALPPDNAGRAAWIQERYEEKDRLLARFHQTGQLT